MSTHWEALVSYLTGPPPPASIPGCGRQDILTAAHMPITDLFPKEIDHARLSTDCQPVSRIPGRPL